MTIVDELVMHAAPSLCFRIAADVERWPVILPHYRWVRFHEREGFGTGRVEMAAWRNFAGPVRWPTWWLSYMHVDEREPAIYFRHLQGITRGMEVKWSFLDHTDGTHVRLTHTWKGPRWPIIGPTAWRAVIAPHFVSVIARRTLAGIARESEHQARATAVLRGSGPHREAGGKEAGK